MRPLPVLPKTAARHGSYVRAVVTARCPLACEYCHLEGDPARDESRAGLSVGVWADLLTVALDCGARKLKLVGGEPLARRDLPEIIAPIRAHDPTVDISLITSGVAPRAILERCFDAGLSRCNVTVHGFSASELARRGGTKKQHALRDEILDTAFLRGRGVKVNYVYTGRECETDLSGLLAWAASRPCTVAVLDDLSRQDFDHFTIQEALHRIAGEPLEQWEEPDPDSLPTLRMRLSSGAVVEVKNRRLGETAPWQSCAVCLRRTICREGIIALRLTHTGVLRPCMDRTDLGVELVPALLAGGREAAGRQWRAWLGEEVAS